MQVRLAQWNHDDTQTCNETSNNEKLRMIAISNT